MSDYQTSHSYEHSKVQLHGSSWKFHNTFFLLYMKRKLSDR